MGRLEVICGPMFSGKSDALIRQVRRSLIAERPTWVFKPAIDARYADTEVVSHDGQRVSARNVATVADIRELLHEEDAWSADAGLVAIDEVQFFAPDTERSGAHRDVEQLVSRLVHSQHHIIVSGLDLDFRGLPFGVVPRLLALADRIHKLTSVCAVCGEDATRSQRLIGGEPAGEDAPVVQVGGRESYEPRCLRHWVYEGAE